MSYNIGDYEFRIQMKEIFYYNNMDLKNIG